MPDSDRLRPHPGDRLDPTLQFMDLAATATALSAEAHPAVDGHRQMTLFRRGPVTLIEFVFAPGGHLKEHQADGVVILHALSGRLRVVADESTRELTEGQLLALGPKVLHSVSAVVASTMLLTIHRGVA